MRKRCRTIWAIFLGLCIALSFCGQCQAESTQELAEAYVTDGSKQIYFQYPAVCMMENEGSMGTLVFLNSNEYVSLCMPKRGLSATESLQYNIGEANSIICLSEDLHVFAAHGDENHRMPYIDTLEIGIDLEDGTGVLLTASCDFGQIEVYDLVLTIVASMTDEASLEEWITNDWIPFVSQQ